ncbi:MAG: RidA family protein [Gammaproteobacteria bacterium]
MVTQHEILQPPNWAKPVGYANGIAAASGRMVFVAGQVGWNAGQQFASDDLLPQFEQALINVLTVVGEAGGKPEHICRITAYCTDKAEYLAVRGKLGEIWRRHMGTCYPAMSMVFVTDLLDSPAKIELEATAVVPA